MTAAYFERTRSRAVSGSDKLCDNLMTHTMVAHTAPVRWFAPRSFQERIRERGAQDVTHIVRAIRLRYQDQIWKETNGKHIIKRPKKRTKNTHQSVTITKGHKKLQ